MTVTTLPTWHATPVPPFPLRRFTVDEYHRIIEAGVLSENDPVELLEGWIAAKTPHSPSHAATIDQTAEVLREKLPAGWRHRIQSAITTDESEPEPDLAIMVGPANRYATRHPSPQDIALLIEVAESSLAHDRGVKGRLYARAGIAAYILPLRALGQHGPPLGRRHIPRPPWPAPLGVPDRLVHAVAAGRRGRPAGTIGNAPRRRPAPGG